MKTTDNLFRYKKLRKLYKKYLKHGLTREVFREVFNWKKKQEKNICVNILNTT